MLPDQSTAPEIILKNQDGKLVKLSDFKGKKNVVLIFYPFDFSSVCSDEVNIFNMALSLFEKNDAVIFGISCDSSYAHKAFRDDRKLQFDLLSDYEPKGKISKLYESYNPEVGCSERTLYIIDKHQNIAWSYLSPMGVNPGADGVLDALEKINK